MFSYFSSFGIELPIALLLIGVLGLRFRVSPTTSIIINALPENVFATVDIFDGKINDYGRFAISHRLIDAASRLYEITYTTTVVGGAARSTVARFRVSERVPNKLLVLSRDGLEGRPSLNNELIEIVYALIDEGGKTRLNTTQRWGPRPVIAQLLARTDLWGGSYRLKGIVETGVPNERPHNLITAAVGLLTGLITLGTFTLLFGFFSLSLILIGVLFVHEAGHLVAFRMMGQPWGRMLFLPFLGAIALPRLAFESQAQAVFAALMGPGLSIILAIGCALPLVWGETPHPVVAILGFVTAVINLFNLIPAEPLDGGIALRSVMTRVIGKYANYGMILLGLGIVGLGFMRGQVLFVIFGAIAVAANLKPRNIDTGLVPMSSLQVTIAIFGYVAMSAAYLTLYGYYEDVLFQFVKTSL